MNKSEYNKKLDKNTMICWWIYAICVFLIYLIDLIKGIRYIEYIIVFTFFLFIPLILATIYYFKSNFENKKIKEVFICSNLLIYTIALVSANNSLICLLIFPVLTVLISYKDYRLILKALIYIIFLNILAICGENYRIQNNYIFFLSQEEKTTTWLVQMICFILTTLFMHFNIKIFSLENKNKKSIKK